MCLSAHWQRKLANKHSSEWIPAVIITLDFDANKNQCVKRIFFYTQTYIHTYLLYFWHFLWELRSTVHVSGLISDVHYGEWNIISSLLITGIPTSQIKPTMAGILCLTHTVLTQHSPSPSKSPCHSSQFSIEKQKRTLFYALNNYTNSPYFNPLTPGAFCQKCGFLDILVIFRLDLSQISFNLVENAFERDGRVLWHFGSGVRRNQDFEIGREGDLCL